MIAVTAFAWAGQVAGTVVHLSGPLLAKKADGSVKVLARKSEVEQGDTLVAEKGTYAQIRFIDNSEITLRPDTTFKIEAFAYDEARPDADSASFNLVKGGLRSVTGLLGKRNKEKFSLKTPTATIGIRGTTFIAQYVPTAAPAMPATPGRPPAAPSLAPGLYVQVVDGAINLTNTGGAMNFTAGQFGFVRNNITPPVIVPPNPALKFMPPPAFSSSSGAAGGASGSQSKAATVDCEVR
ncbi:FecR domain-containing protein [Massilia sp. RP-1-19]|uniref:FecR domain-containing protein n=2 Tax=Massilia polaris TaxID=2728846 RepID=A0A848HRF5_9BURK|nr:FecR domain-containing protein [Massilia polaris]